MAQPTCANVAPRLTADIYDKFIAGDLKGALEAQFALAPLRLACNMVSLPGVIKEALNLLGFKPANVKNQLRNYLMNKKQN